MANFKPFVRHLKRMPIVQQDTIPDCLVIPKGRRRSEPSKNFADDEPRVETCQYPGDTEKLEFCGKSVVSGKSYCQAHYDKCYIKRDSKTKRREFTMSMIPGM